MTKIQKGMDYDQVGNTKKAEQNFNTAINKISAFQNEVEVQKGKKIDEDDADLLLDLSDILIYILEDYDYGCGGSWKEGDNILEIKLLFFYFPF